MSELATTAPPPPLRLIRRSRTHGIEVLSAPDGRKDENQALDIVQHLGRGIVETAKDGSRLCLGGGSTPLEVVDTGDWRRRSRYRTILVDANGFHSAREALI